jgi:hypothetical protein
MEPLIEALAVKLLMVEDVEQREKVQHRWTKYKCADRVNGRFALCGSVVAFSNE